MSKNNSRVIYTSDIDELTREPIKGELEILNFLVSFIISDSLVEYVLKEKLNHNYLKQFSLSFKNPNIILGTKLALADYFVLFHSANKTLADKLREKLLDELMKTLNDISSYNEILQLASKVGSLIDKNSIDLIEPETWRELSSETRDCHPVLITEFLRALILTATYLCQRLNSFRVYPESLYIGFFMDEPLKLRVIAPHFEEEICLENSTPKSQKN